MDNALNNALQQLTGFVHAKQGHNVESLAGSMGLTAIEWDQIRVQALWLPKDIVTALDDYFLTQSLYS